jgi:hypothetical protein
MYILPLYFLISFCIGIFFVYISTPKPKIIIKYPTPQNAGKIIYKDNSGLCYKYLAKEVKCPKNTKEIKMFDIQH